MGKGLNYKISNKASINQKSEIYIEEKNDKMLIKVLRILN